ncbi:serine hydrolase domain-containing protein [Ascidiimonas sp. W6]|uniref:serine hydrolase domain-containing protein n=1 Tax=Ascidiimonas meishanensis TaxID=3128903 RepID=UPI0030EF792F
MKKSILSIFLMLLLSSCHQQTKKIIEPANDDKIIKDSLTEVLMEIHKKGFINGFSVAIVTQDSTLYENGIGYADTENKIAYTKNTVQNIASISKTLIGIALLKAQEMGKLSLDDPIEKHLPFKVKNPYYPLEEITIKQLATHTSSIKDANVYNEKSYVLNTKQDSTSGLLKEVSENFNPPENKISIEDFLKNVLSEDGKWYTKESFLKKKPGALFEYSNVGATLAALVLEGATGESYHTFTSKHILQPLKMKSSGWSFDAIDLDLAQHSKLYATPEKEFPLYSLITYPDGGLITSSHDLGLYLTELIKGYSGNGTLLKKESYHELFKKQMSPDQFTERDEENPYNDEYDFGIFIGFSAKGYIGHTGGDPGVSSFMFFDAEKKIGRILIINTDLNNKEGVDEFYAVWDTLGAYQERF